MNKTEQVIYEMMVENTGRALGDSGDYYGRHYERNKENGIQTDDEYNIDAWENKDGTIELDATVNIFPFLTKHLDKSYKSDNLQKQLYDYLKENNINPLSIFEVQDALKEIDIVDEDYYDGEDIEEHIDLLENISEVANTYNGESILSQTLQFITFEYLGNDYVLLQIHGGCDVRGGYTYPQIFEINDYDYFVMYSHCMEIYCENCDNVTFTMDMYDLINTDGEYLDNEVSDLVYIDDNDVVRCKKCGGIIKQFVCDF